MLELKNVSKIYKTKSGDVYALNSINLYFEETGLVFITGKSGSGKTTLLNCIGGLDNFTEGEIFIKEKSTKNFTKSDYDSYRNTYIGFVFQEYNLLDNLSIKKNISLATELQAIKNNEDKIKEILKKVDLEGVENRKPQELSGGQRQRVAIARALIKNPSIIIADEPTGALDSESGHQILSLLKKLSKEKLVIVVSHDLENANKFADRIINLKDGKIESDITINVDNNKNYNILEDQDILSVKRGANLKDADLKRIKQAVLNGKNLTVSDSINTTKQKTIIKTKKVYDTSSPFIKTHMSFIDTIKLGLNTLKTKPIRLVITILLCAIAFSIFGIFDALSIYNESRLTVNALSSTITNGINISSFIKEDNNNTYDINVNESLLNTLEKQTKYDFKGVYNSYYVGTSIPSELNNNNAYTISKYYYYKSLRGVVEFNEADLNNYNFNLVDGRLPNDFNEMAISEYFANCMVNWWYTYKNQNNESITIKNINQIINTENPLTLTIGTTGHKVSYKIVGIINTGKISKKFDSLLDNFENGSTLDQNEFFNYINNGFYLFGFVKPGFVDNAIKKYNTLTKYVNKAYAYQFSTTLSVDQSPAITANIDNFYNFNDLQNLSNSNYVFINNNKTTLSGNEILLDVKQFEFIFADLINFLKANANNNPNFENYASEIENYISLMTKNVSVLDKLNAVKGALTYLNEIQSSIDQINGINRPESVFNRELIVKKLDTSKYQEGSNNLVEVKFKNNKFKVVGFYTGINLTPTNSIITSSEGLTNLGINLAQGNYSNFIATNTGNANTNKLSSLFLNTNGVCYNCNNNAIAMVKANKDFFSKLSLLFLIVSAVFAMFSIIMFSNFISSSIKNKYNEIGILRAMGARGIDILKMFVIEAIALAIINAILASIIALVGCTFVNIFLSNYLSIYIPLAAFRFRQVLIIFALSILFGAISAIIPIASISKQKPVETIRKSY